MKWIDWKTSQCDCLSKCELSWDEDCCQKAAFQEEGMRSYLRERYPFSYVGKTVSPLSYTVHLFTKPLCPQSHYEDKPSMCQLLSLDQVNKCIPCRRWTGKMCFRVLQLLIISGFPTIEFFCLRDHQGDDGCFDLQCLCGLIFLFDLGESSCILNFSIQFWNSVFMFSVEVDSVRNISLFVSQQKVHFLRQR